VSTSRNSWRLAWRSFRWSRVLVAPSEVLVLAALVILTSNSLARYCVHWFRCVQSANFIRHRLSVALIVLIDWHRCQLWIAGLGEVGQLLGLGLVLFQRVMIRSPSCIQPHRQNPALDGDLCRLQSKIGVLIHHGHTVTSGHQCVSYSTRIGFHNLGHG